MRLTEEQSRELETAKGPLRVEDERTGTAYFVVTEGQYLDILADREAGLPMTVVSRLVDESMREEDEGDPLLAEYQSMREGD